MKTRKLKDGGEVAVHDNDGIRKLCGCPRPKWAKCPHAWHFNYAWQGKDYRFSLNKYLGQKRDALSKSQADREAESIRIAIRQGRFNTSPLNMTAPSTAETGAAVERIGASYFAKHLNRKTGEPLSRAERYRWDLMMRTEILRLDQQAVRFGSLPVADVSRHDINGLKEALRAVRSVSIVDSKGRTYVVNRGGAVAVNRALGRLRAFFAWAVKNDLVPMSPFKKGSETVIEMFAEAERERRLAPGEEERLLDVANPHLRGVITAALETGCRIQEILSLQLKQVRWDLNEIHLPASKTKARRPRDLPMSQRLRSLLEMRRYAVDGREHCPDAFLFGDSTGVRVKSIKVAWENARLKAHGVRPLREKTGRLSAACRKRLQEIDLHFHDLRREAGSRFLEGGMAANYVQKFLDHSNLSTTSRYLKVERQGMQAALRRFENGRCENLANSAAEETPNVPPRPTANSAKVLAVN